MTSDEWVEQMGVTLLDKANLQLAAKEQEVAALKAELTAAYESLGRDDTRARDAESQVADLKRKLEEARKTAIAEYVDDHGMNCDCCQHVMIDVTASQSGEKQHCIAGDCEGEGVACGFTWHEACGKADERAEVAEARVKELEQDREKLLDNATASVTNLISQSSDQQSRLAALISAAEPFMALTRRDTTEYHALASAVQKAREGQNA